MPSPDGPPRRPAAGPTFAVLIPALDAGATIDAVVRAALRHTPRVLVVDDGSTDDTAARAAAAGAEVARHLRPRGKGAALRTGIDRILAGPPPDAIVTLDADGQHDPDDIPRLVGRLARDAAAVVVGSRAARFDAMTPPRRSMNRFSSVALRFFAGLDLPDSQCGFRVYAGRFLAHHRLRGRRYESEMEILMQAAAAGGRVISEPVAAAVPDGRATSHYRTWRDTWRIVGAVLAHRAWRAARGRP
jgi:glycosyltransferase involved in cell wall biosynthesis